MNRNLLQNNEYCLPPVRLLPRCGSHGRAGVRLLAVLCLLTLAEPGLGQYGYRYSPRAYSPSQSSSVNWFGLRGVGRGEGRGILYETPKSFSPAGGLPAGLNPLGSSSSSTFRRSTPSRWQDNRLTLGGRGYGASGRGSGALVGASALMGSSGYSGYSGLSGRNLGMWGQSALARSYSDVLGGNWELGVPFYKARDDPLNVYSWAQPPMVQAPPASQPAVEETGNAFLARSAPERQVSLATLVSSQLSGQRRLHLANGWEAFGTGDYRTACSEFALADGYGSISPAERFEARVPLLYARVAARQYAEATWCLKWMLETGSRPDLDTAGLFARLVPDLPARYGRQSDLDRHLAEIADLAMRSSNAYQDARTDSKATTELPRLSEAMWQSKALQLVFLYATPAQRSRAIFEAKSFAGAPRPWNELGKLLQDGNLDRGENPGGPPAGTGKLNIGNFPFNLSQETPPQDVLSHFPPAS